MNGNVYNFTSESALSSLGADLPLPLTVAGAALI
jgi:hypothetical protein